MRDTVARVRRLLEEATRQPDGPSPEEQAARSAYEIYAFNTAAAPVLDQSRRSRLEREILRLSNWYGWHQVVEEFLDQHLAATISDLDMDSLEALTESLRRLQECVQHGFGSPKAPPAS